MGSYHAHVCLGSDVGVGVAQSFARPLTIALNGRQCESESGRILHHRAAVQRVWKMAYPDSLLKNHGEINV